MIDVFKWLAHNHSGSFEGIHDIKRHHVRSLNIQQWILKAPLVQNNNRHDRGTGTIPPEAATADKSGISTPSSRLSRNTAVYSMTIKEFIISGNGAQVKAAVNHILSHQSLPDESDTWLLFLSLCIISRNSLLLFWLGFSSHPSQHLS